MAKVCYSRKGASIGIFIVAIGLILLLDQMQIVDAGTVFKFFWPAVFVFFGLEIAICRDSPGRTLVGVLIVAFGLFLLLGSFGVLHVGIGTMWPLLLIIWGIWVIGRAFGAEDNLRAKFRTAINENFGDAIGQQPGEPAGQQSGEQSPRDFAGELKFRIRSNIHNRLRDTVNNWAADSGNPQFDYFAIFGGVKQRITVKNFRGGRLFAICGGWDIDLTRADIEGQTAVIDASALMGGGEIRVPENWIVELHGVPLFGGYSDETHQVIQDPNTAKRLIIKGIACMGGVVIKN